VKGRNKWGVRMWVGFIWLRIGTYRGLYVRVTHIFQISKNHVKIVVSKLVTCSKYHTEGPQIGW
jgi:hypothetical protein